MFFLTKYYKINIIVLKLLKKIEMFEIDIYSYLVTCIHLSFEINIACMENE